MESSILLIGADAVGTETLKNLVLPGVGRITVLDDKVVAQSDLGSNFFVDPSSLGKQRAEVVTELLIEMNEDVAGTALVGNIGSVPNLDEFIAPFSLIVAANMCEEQLLVLAQKCWNLNVPLLVVRAMGMLGSLRLQTPRHDMIESKQQEFVWWDLRLMAPFRELEDFSAKFDLSPATQLNSTEYAHVPYVVILIQVLNAFRANNGGQGPKYADKKSVQEMIKKIGSAYLPPNLRGEGQEEQEAALKWKKESGYEGLLNFHEAVANVDKIIRPLNLSAELAELVQQEVTTPTLPPTEFSLLMRALHAFMSTHDSPMGPVPPLCGQVPDMVSTSNFYVELQSVFENKAASDRAEFHALVQQQVAEAVAAGHPVVTITEETEKIFCTNIYNCKRLCTRSIAQERLEPAADAFLDALGDPFVDVEQTPFMWYLSLRAADRFFNKNNRYPGDFAGNDEAALQADSEAVWTELQALLVEYGNPALPDVTKPDAEGNDVTTPCLSLKHAREITRYGGAELHATAAVIGGAASQEAVKVITHQYTPINNTYFYNGIACCGATYAV